MSVASVYLPAANMKNSCLYVGFIVCTLSMAGCSSNRVATHDLALESAISNETGYFKKPNLSGTWILNEALSDDPRKQIKAAMKNGRGSMGGKEGRGHGKGNGKGRGGKGRGSKGQDGEGDIERHANGQESPLKKIMDAMLLAETLELTHEEPLLFIITDGENRQRVYTDNRGSSISANSAMHQKVVTAGWEKDILFVEITSDSEPKLTQKYKLNTDPMQLLVSTTVQHSNLNSPVVIMRVYDPAIE